MGFFSKISERELDAVLAGRAARGELDDVATFFRELRNDLEEPLAAGVEAQHLAAIFHEVQHLQPSVSEPRTATLSGARTLPNPFRWVAARATIAGAGLAAFTALGGAAFAGVLPAPVQSKVADIARHVGVSLPDKRHHTKPLGGTESGVQHTSTLDQHAGAGPVNGAQGSTPSNDENGGAQGGTQGNDQNDGAQGSQSTTEGAQPRDAGSQGTDSQGSGTHQDDLTPQGGAQEVQTNADQGQQTTTVQVVAPSQQGTKDTQNGQSQPTADMGGGSDR